MPSQPPAIGEKFLQVFISWSGDRSRALGTALKEYLPLVIQSVTPWFSPDDIDKGSKWLGDLTQQLHKHSVAIVCITPESVNSPWLLFEAGALSKALDASWVCPVLLGIEPSDIKGPLAQFQATKASKEDIRKLLGTLNRRLDSPLIDGQIDRIHDALWKDFETKINEIPKAAVSAFTPHRSQNDILVEVLERVRGLERRLAESQPTIDPSLTEPLRHLSLGANARRHFKNTPVTADIHMRLDRFSRLHKSSVKKIRDMEVALKILPPGESTERAALSAELEVEQSKLGQYENEIGRMTVKLKRAEGQ